MSKIRNPAGQVFLWLLLSALPTVQAKELERLPSLTLGLALEAASAAVQACTSQGLHETVVVVDADGVERVALRGDYAGVHSLDSAYRKAFTAASFGQATSQLQSLVESSPDAAGLRQLDKVLLVGGGLPIFVNETVIGAIGAAGARGAGLDEACARAGLDKIRDQLK